MPQSNLKLTTSDTSPVRIKRRQSKRGLETEQKLLTAANDVFWTNGYSGATIMEIVNASGISVGSFYHRFSDKEALLELATVTVFKEFQMGINEFDFTRARNADVFTLFYCLTQRGRAIVSGHRGIYRAMSELAQSDYNRYGTLAKITPILINRVQSEIYAYQDQLKAAPSSGDVSAAVQLLAMTVMQTELGLGPGFPSRPESFASTIARGCCGILGYTGQTDAPARTEAT